MYFKDKRLFPLQRDYNYFINEFEGENVIKGSRTMYRISYKV